MSAPTPIAPARAGSGRPGIRGIARGGVLNLVGAAVVALTNVVLVVIVTRSMPKSTAGEFFALTSVFLLAETLACLGTGTGLVYFTARTRSLGRPDRIRAFQRVALAPVLVLSVVAAAVLIIWSPQFSRIAGGGEGTRAALVVLALLLPMAALSDTLLAGTRGHGTMVPTVVLDRTGRPLVQIGLVAVVVSAGSLPLLAGAWALPWVASGLVAAWWLVRLGRRRQAAAGVPAAPQGTTPSATWREFWRFTWPRSVTSVVQLALQRMDIVLITVLIGPAHAAVYTAATRFLVVGQSAMNAISNAAQPRIAELLSVDDRRSAKTVYQSATAWIVLLTWPLYLLSALFGGSVLKIFGHGYSAGLTVILVLSGAMLIATACGMVDMLLNMAGRTTWTLINSIIGLTVMVVVDVLLIPRIGILGAGIGWAAAIVTNNALPLTQLFLSLRLHPFGPATLRAAALCAVCFGALPGLTRILLPGNGAAALVAVLIGAGAFVATALRWRARLGLPALSTVLPRMRRPASPADVVASGGAA